MALQLIARRLPDQCILQVHNPFSPVPGVTWLSLAIRVFLCWFENHSAFLKDGVVHEVIGKGKKETPIAEWLQAYRRKVRVYDPGRPLVIPEKVGLITGRIRYGHLDLIQILLYLIRSRWFGIAREWNGRDGVKLWPGVICSEYLGLAMREPKAWLITPADVPAIAGVKYLFSFET